MRRTFNNHVYQPLPNSDRTNAIEEQNEELTEALGDKVHMLKSLTIDLGHEVKEHNKFLSGLEEDFERSGGFLSKTINRVVRLGKGSHNYYILYLLLFSFIVFLIIWVLMR
ncbi:conserved hypothetical protein [Pediculus humanus corporis]|uniref:t-SNARE coiled-coil homology domain-containing protein n=1 Tax=Pediculus humanus subsp. corporis TaxID=121224 RepID=E0W482_PEDHC|nr:uncharacterized protein Phum_PHUM616150 [Pediculus humanus corporis]EEB20438.1 conserved hypothetical protein [Pediculus humanus corporis]